MELSTGEYSIGEIIDNVNGILETEKIPIKMKINNVTTNNYPFISCKDLETKYKEKLYKNE